MSRETIMYLVGGGCAVLALAAHVAFILIPAVTAYERLWERVVAGVLTLYVLATFIAIGVVGGVLFVWYFGDRL